MASPAALAAAAAASGSNSTDSSGISTEFLVEMARQAGEKASTIDKGMVGGIMEKITTFTSGRPSFAEYMKCITNFFEFLESIHLSNAPLLVNMNNREAVKVPYFDDMKICQKTQVALLKQIENTKRTETEVFDIYARIFEKIYQKYHSDIVQGYYLEEPSSTSSALEEDELIYNDKWIVDGAIQFEMSEERKFSLSCFYNTALKLQEIAEDQMADASDEERAERPELTYPDIFMLNLYRIFDMSLGANPERLMIKTAIGKIELTLGISEGEIIIVNEKTVEKLKLGFEAMVKSYNGGKMPGQLNTPNARIITQAINKTIGNSDLQRQAYKVLSQVGNVGTPEDGVAAYFDAAIKGLSDPALRQSVLSTIESVTNSISELQEENSRGRKKK